MSERSTLTTFFATDAGSLLIIALSASVSGDILSIGICVAPLTTTFAPSAALYVTGASAVPLSSAVNVRALVIAYVPSPIITFVATSFDAARAAVCAL